MTGTGRTLTVGERDSALDQRLSDELDRHNFGVTGDRRPREFTVRVTDDDGALAAGLSGWTWADCAGIAMVWVRDDARGEGWGRRLLEAAEAEARRDGCRQVVVSSFTFQAPDFYRANGYVEFARSDGVPLAGSADVHFRKTLVPAT
jgi:GNAT superfamily N-acetyltransferase